VVDCGHDRVVAHVGVDMDPEMFGGGGAGQMGNGALGRSECAGRADHGEVERE
jgi:hypothetical protein